jgi:hypothetical protein
MSVSDLRGRVLLAALLFTVLRLAEAIFATVAGELTAFFAALLAGREPYARLAWGDFQGAWMVSQTYYVSFGYIYFSAIAFFVSGLVFGLDSKRKLLVTNLGAFVVHSLAVIGLIFSAKIDTILWALWVEVVLFNWAASNWIWRWRSNAISNSTR